MAGEFEGEDLERVRNYFFKSETRQEQLRLALALEQRKSRVPMAAAAPGRSTATVTTTVTQFQPRRRSFIPYLAIAATLIVAVGIGFGLYQRAGSPSDVDDLNQGLVALNTAYRQERPVEARLSDLNYAPRPIQRGGTPANVDYVQRDLAMRLLTKAATDTPSVASHRALGQYYLAERQFDKAIEQFNAALALDANDAKSHIDLGAAFLEKGKLDTGEGKTSEYFARSLAHLVKGLRLDQSLLAGYFNRALVYEYMNRPDEARGAWQDYVQRDPNSPWGEEAKSRVSSNR